MTEQGFVVRYRPETSLGERFPSARYPHTRALPREEAEDLHRKMPGAAQMEVVDVAELAAKVGAS